MTLLIHASFWRYLFAIMTISTFITAGSVLAKKTGELQPEILKSTWRYAIGTGTEPPNASLNWKEIEKPYVNTDGTHNQVLWVATSLPALEINQPTLYIRAVTGPFQAFIDGKLIYQFGYEQGKPSKGFLGRPLLLIRLPDHSAGKEIRFVISINAVLPKTGFFKTIYYGSASGFIRNLMEDEVGQVFASILFILLAIVGIVVSISIRTSKPYLAFSGYLFSIAIWIFSGDPSIKFFLIASPRFWETLCLSGLYLTPFFLAMLFRQIAAKESIGLRIMKWVQWGHFAFVVIVIPLGVADVINLDKTVIPFNQFLPVFFLLMGFEAIRRLRCGQTNERIFGLGLILFLAFCIREFLMTMGVLVWEKRLIHWGVTCMVLALAWIAARILRQQFKEKNLMRAQLELASERYKVARQVSHDIRSPLSALDVVLSSVSSLPEEQRILARLAINRIKDIANNLLLQNRQPVAGKDACKVNAMVDEPRSVQLLTSLIEDLCSEKRIQCRSKLGIEILFQPDQQGYGLFADIQPMQLKRVLSNLINNSVEALGEKGIVNLLLRDQNNKITIEVSDNGKGIPKDILPRLAQQNESFGKSDSVDSGTGIGLYHARTTVEAWGGEFGIESEEGHGTTIRLAFSKAPAPKWFVEKLWLKPNTAILVGDDDNSIHQIWDGRFASLKTKEKGIKILHVSTPAMLEQAFMEQKPELYLVDYEFLGQSETGLDVIERLGIASKAILVTSRYEEPRVMKHCIRLGMKLISKRISSLVPILFEEPIRDSEKFNAVVSDGSIVQMRPSSEAIYDAVHIDDDPLSRRTWLLFSKSKNVTLLSLEHPREFDKIADSVSKTTPIYIDYEFGEGEITGLEFSKTLFSRGYTKLYISTGHDSANVPNAEHLVGIIGKDCPWA